MEDSKARPTVDELFELLKRSSLPTVLVEGKDDIIFYRKIEESLQELGVDMLPAGNKDAVLKLRERILQSPISAPIIFVVDKDLWVHEDDGKLADYPGVITTEGYSIENDLFIDGDLESLLSAEELDRFRAELERFSKWYALAVKRHLSDGVSGFRVHPGKVLDDEEFYELQTRLKEDEVYPDDLYELVRTSYSRYLRGKSLFALLLRELSARRREVKFSGKQLMAFGASRKGQNFIRLHDSIKESLEAVMGVK